MQLEEDLKGFSLLHHVPFFFSGINFYKDLMTFFFDVRIKDDHLFYLVSDNWFNNEDGALKSRGSGAHELEPRSSSARPLLGKCVS